MLPNLELGAIHRPWRVVDCIMFSHLSLNILIVKQYGIFMIATHHAGVRLSSVVEDELGWLFEVLAAQQNPVVVS